MKILFFAPSAYLLGGVQDWLSDLVPGLRREGYNVIVAVPDGLCHSHERYSRAFPKLDCIAFKNPTGSQEGRIVSIMQLILSVQPDLIVGVNIAAIYPAVARLLSRGFCPGRLAITLHAIESDYLEDLRRYRPIIHAVVVTNKLTAELVAQQSGISPDRILYAPYGVHVPDLIHNTPAIDGPLRIAWVGRFDQPQKRVHDLEAIVDELGILSCPYILSLAGAGPEAPSLQQRLDPLIRQGKVRWLGRVDRHELRHQVYDCHDVLLITSSWETGPIVAWEAMAAGVVVVSSRYVGSGSEAALIDGKTALMFPVGDSPAAAAALCRLRDPNLFMKLANNGFEMVRRRYSDSASLGAWLAAFRDSEHLPPLPLDVAEASRLGACAPSGRVDRWLGVSRAERLRHFLGLSFRHSSAGSEWPHSLHGKADNGRLLAMAARIENHA